MDELSDAVVAADPTCDFKSFAILSNESSPCCAAVPKLLSLLINSSNPCLVLPEVTDFADFAIANNLFFACSALSPVAYKLSGKSKRAFFKVFKLPSCFPKS